MAFWHILILQLVVCDELIWDCKCDCSYGSGLFSPVTVGKHSKSMGTRWHGVAFWSTTIR